jgi:hypothetical protein
MRKKIWSESIINICAGSLMAQTVPANIIV